MGERVAENNGLTKHPSRHINVHLFFSASTICSSFFLFNFVSSYFYPLSFPSPSLYSFSPHSLPSPLALSLSLDSDDNIWTWTDYNDSTHLVNFHRLFFFSSSLNHSICLFLQQMFQLLINYRSVKFLTISILVV